ncbi:type VI secretion system tube protein IglC [Francisella tularensis]|uniref:type VI secretion system tube protein IglC n=1 Tax=Francisella tularensis TaxID=263 RepID=UPI003C6D1614
MSFTLVVLIKENVRNIIDDNLSSIFQSSARDMMIKLVNYYKKHQDEIHKTNHL